MTRTRLILLTAIAAVLCLGWLLWPSRRATPPLPSPTAPSSPSIAANSLSSDDTTPTLLYAHNIRLRKGPNFRIYIRWIRGLMERTNQHIHPSFDDPESFVLRIQKGVVHANIGDIALYLNAASPANAPLKNISIQPDGNQLKIHGNLHKIISFPIELTGSLSSTKDGRVQFHTTKLSVLKMPMKGLLGTFHIKLDDLVHTTNIRGIEIAGDDIVFDTTRLLPPPHIHGELTSVRVNAPDIEVIYGDSPNDDSKLAQWHNFLRLRGGTIDFGKLTMRDADLTMIDATEDPWFELDLVNYQAQLVQGTSRLTPQAGLEVFMPNLDEAARTKANRSITLEWLKDRNRTVPADVPLKK